MLGQQNWIPQKWDIVTVVLLTDEDTSRWGVNEALLRNRRVGVTGIVDRPLLGDLWVIENPQSGAKTIYSIGELQPKYDPTHTCPAVIVGCMDRRFLPKMDAYMVETYGVGRYDRINIAGGVYYAGLVTEMLQLSITKHNVRRVLLVQHEGCAMYESFGTDAWWRQREDMTRIRNYLLSVASGLEESLVIERYYIELETKKWLHVLDEPDEEV